MQYKYVTDNNLENIQTYMYSEYFGLDFLKAYWQSRLENITSKELSRCDMENKIENYIQSDVSAKLFDLWEKIKNVDIGDIKDHVDPYVKKFEVKKRLYRKYETDGRAVLESGYDEYASYILLGMIVSELYRGSGNLKYLNCMLKITDTLISVRKAMDGELVQIAEKLMTDELEYIDCLLRKNSIDVEEI